MKKILIEARINEYTMRGANRHVPWTAAEIARAATQCREAGAAIVHFHTRQPDGRPDFSYEAYRDAIRRIREQSDILVHPTLGAQDRQATPQDRLAHIVRLASEGLAPDFAPMDMGSTNADKFDAQAGWFVTQDKVYENSIATLQYFAQTLRSLGVRPQLVNWNVPMLRTTAAFMKAGLLDRVAYVYLGISEQSLALHPGTRQGLAALKEFLPTQMPIEWTVALGGGNLLALVDYIATEGGHVSIGLGDYPYRELGEPTNADVIRHVTAMAAQCGREVATPADARAMLEIR